jgi:hypothetical protein
MLRKVLVSLILVVAASRVSADMDSCWLYVKASDTSSHSTTTIIGWYSQYYTGDLDEDTQPSSAGDVGVTRLPVVASEFPGTNDLSIYDWRTPEDVTAAQQTWNLLAYFDGSGSSGPLTITISEKTYDTYPWSFGPLEIDYPSGGKTIQTIYTATSPLPAAGMTFNVQPTNVGQVYGIPITVIAGNATPTSVPEPGGLAALASGLLALTAFRVRRRI